MTPDVNVVNDRCGINVDKTMIDIYSLQVEVSHIPLATLGVQNDCSTTHFINKLIVFVRLFHSGANLCGELRALRSAAQVARQDFAFPDDGEDGFLDPEGDLHLAHVPKHHHGRKAQSGWVSLVLA